MGFDQFKAYGRAVNKGGFIFVATAFLEQIIFEIYCISF